MMLFDQAVETASSTPRPKPHRRAALPIVSGLGMAAVAIAFGSLNSEAVVSGGFERAFAGLERTSPQLASRAYDGIAGSEEFWLRAEPNSNIVKAVAVGQQITLNANGTQRRLTITGIADSADAGTHIQTAAEKTRTLVITCREGDLKNGREVRLRLDAGQIVELPVQTAAAPRAL